MECRSCTEALTALLDNELAPGDTRLVEAHLGTCSRCRQEFDSLSYVYRLTDQMVELDIDDHLWTRISPQLYSRSFFPNLSSLFRRPWIPATALLSVFLVLMFAYLLYPTQHPLEAEFATFIEQRERISAENVTILLAAPGSTALERQKNPFVRSVSFMQQNPFQE